jgi:hypothetical protein
MFYMNNYIKYMKHQKSIFSNIHLNTNTLLIIYFGLILINIYDKNLNKFYNCFKDFQRNQNNKYDIISLHKYEAKRNQLYINQEIFCKCNLKFNFLCFLLFYYWDYNSQYNLLLMIQCNFYMSNDTFHRYAFHNYNSNVLYNLSNH